jgi:hypothetical protein
MERVTLEDRRIIARQIGRRPRGLLGVPVRCSHGYPQVVEVRPVVDGRPFPTLYWLTCPFLNREVARWEAAGWIGRLEGRLKTDEPLMRELVRAHEEYREERAALAGDGGSCREETVSDIQREGAMTRGIGGIADWRRLKCLHLHVAHALAGENPIGRIVLDALPAMECSSKNGDCSALE